jgi:CubicO group peptidase (beta-lactamase class C family)
MRVIQGATVLACLLLVVLPLGNLLGRPVAQAGSEQPDYWPTEGWRTSPPELQGMSSAPLRDMYDYIRDEDLPLDSLLIVRNGYIVYEDYPNPDVYDENDLHILHSVTKSFTSALVGIAVGQGYINSAQDSVLSYFPNRTIANLDAWKEAMTIEDLLNMMAGMEWDEWTYPYTDARNSFFQMMFNADSIQFMLDRPMVAEPGTVWVYSGGASHLLAGLVHEATGHTPLEYANEFLFGPLGIDASIWTADQQGVNFGGAELHLRPRDMAKFGFLYLNNGTWAGQQIIPAAWVEQSRQSAAYPWDDTGYGYQWWKQLSAGTYEARGLNSQWIVVCPEDQLVVVLTASDTTGRIWPFDFLADFIIAAIEAFVPLDPLFWMAPTVLVLVLGVPLAATAVYFFRKRYRP